MGLSGRDLLIGDIVKVLNYDGNRCSYAYSKHNHIHPFQQMNSGFSPRQHTAKICLQVLKVAIHKIGENFRKIDP
jgi:hypothetical protein